MRKGDLTRGRILDEGLRLASRDGLEGLSIGVLADVLRMSKSGLFAHFGSKEALQIAVLEHAGERFYAAVLSAADRHPAGVQQLRSIFDAWLRWIEDPALPGGCPVMGACFELDGRGGQVRDFLVTRQHKLRQTLTDLFRAAGATAPEQPAFELLSLLLGFHHAARILNDPNAHLRAHESFEAILKRANILAPRAASRPPARRKRG